MDKDFLDVFFEMYRINVVLLDMVREGRWENFNILSERYVILMNSIIDCISLIFNEDGDAKLKSMIDVIFNNEVEIVHKLEERLLFLKDKMNLIESGKQYENAIFIGIDLLSSEFH